MTACFLSCKHNQVTLRWTKQCALTTVCLACEWALKVGFRLTPQSHIAPLTAAYCTIDSCLLHHWQLPIAPMAAAYCTIGSCLLHHWQLPFAQFAAINCIIGSCLLHNLQLPVALLVAAYCTIGSCLLHHWQLPTAPLAAAYCTTLGYLLKKSLKPLHMQIRLLCVVSLKYRGSKNASPIWRACQWLGYNEHLFLFWQIQNIDILFVQTSESKHFE